MKKFVFFFVLLIVLSSAEKEPRHLSVVASEQVETGQKASSTGLVQDKIIYSKPILLPKCGPNEALTPSGCWNSCTDPKFKRCPKFFAAIYKPQFCAYTKDEKYVNETYDCQACQKKEAFAIRKGACSCDFMKCGSGYVCKNGECVKNIIVDPIPCRFLCVIGYVCRNGKCVPQTVIDQCATIKCGFGTVCKDGKCVQPTPVDSCAIVSCPSGSVCENGKCIYNQLNPCAVVKCAQGTHCDNGKCIPNIHVDPFVPNHAPVEPCGTSACLLGTFCKNGKCVATIPQNFK